ncbi:MAG TPA: alpha/beta hydrolase [Candidatus Eisenbergiella merdavium]|uniref:Alpha/beta hydrolase n=1 Tax=Candidatus Eisenbergiella merdavium TaxID=2838551 RepID=A0A9D2SQP8_9FIRM|nr:alpha/beta hydrolase [Candidatus Eisenbergiella merdavium]
MTYSLTEFDRAHIEGWEKMKEEIRALKWREAPLITADGFTSKLIFLPPVEFKERKKGLLIICAGGGFTFKSQHEARPVAEFFRNAGINTAILDYHVTNADPGKDRFLTKKLALEDGIAAVRYCRYHAEELNIREDRIAIGGFSAGGITAALTAVMADEGISDSEDAVMRTSAKPDAALIFYGAFSDTEIDRSHPYDEEIMRKNASLDAICHITSKTPPMFLFQTHRDDPRIGLRFAMQLARYGVPFEIHTFEQGEHGGALFNGKDPEAPFVEHTSKWAEIAADWLKMRDFI